MNIAPGEALHCTTVCQRLKRKQDRYAEICQTFLVLGPRPKNGLKTNLCYTFFFSNGRRMSYLGEFCCYHLLPPTKSKILRTKRQPRWPPLPSSPPTFDWGFPPNVYRISMPTFVPRYIVHTKYGVVLLHCNGFTTPA